MLDRVCGFLGVSYSPEDKSRLLEELSMARMKTNEAVNDTEVMVRLGQFKADEGSFIRKGKSGGWKDYFDEDMLRKMEAWKLKNCRELEVPVEKLWSS